MGSSTPGPGGCDGPAAGPPIPPPATSAPPNDTSGGSRPYMLRGIPSIWIIIPATTTTTSASDGDSKYGH